MVYKQFTTFKVFIPSYMGCGCSKRIGITLATQGLKKAFIIYDKGTYNAGIIQPIIDNVANAGLDVNLFDGVQPDPPDDIIEAASDQCNGFGADVIVAIGGGSSIDSAKGVNVLVNNPKPLTSHIGLAKTLKKGLPLVAVPTTSGTGSETTDVAVLSVMNENGRKDAIVSHACLATMTFLDPELTVGVPAKMTAATGMDAFAHATEAITSSMANPVSDELGGAAVRLITKWLPIAFDDGKNIEAREKMQLASYIAGAAFQQTNTQLGHGFGHAMGTFFHVMHGIGCTVCLPWVIARSAKYEPHKVRIITEAMGLDIPESASNDELGKAVKEAIIKLSKRVQIPNIKDLGIPKEAMLSIVPAIVAEKPTLTAPWIPNAAELAAIVEEAYDI